MPDNLAASFPEHSPMFTDPSSDLDALWSALPKAPQADTGANGSTQDRDARFALSLLRRAQAENWRRIGIAPVRAGCGATSTLAMLLLGLTAQHAARTIALDLNLRAPALAASLGTAHRNSGGAFLQGAADVPDCAQRIGPVTAVVGQSQPTPDPLALLMDRNVAERIDQLEAEYRPDLLLFDLAAALDYPDVMAFAPQLDAVILCAMADQTTQADLVHCRDVLSPVLPIFGTVLTRSRYA